MGRLASGAGADPAHPQRYFLLNLSTGGTSVKQNHQATPDGSNAGFYFFARRAGAFSVYLSREKEYFAGRPQP